MKPTIKPVIVTNDNSCFYILAVGYLTITGPAGTREIPNGGYYSCKNLITGQYADIFESQIKLFARERRKRKSNVTDY
jgi:hypothetical protein